jgi:hypothetical protein|tara:strand:- start:243 stop:563 length:321 start_codon:yes stop_codon:yes gene_type:complete
MPFSVLVVTQAMVLLAFLMLAFLAVNHSKVKLTHDPFATNQLDFLQVTQSNQQVTTPRHLTARTALLPMSHATCNAHTRTWCSSLPRPAHCITELCRAHSSVRTAG